MSKGSRARGARNVCSISRRRVPEACLAEARKLHVPRPGVHEEVVRLHGCACTCVPGGGVGWVGDGLMYLFRIGAKKRKLACEAVKVQGEGAHEYSQLCRAG